MRTGYQNPAARTIASTVSGSAGETSQRSGALTDSATASATDEDYITHDVSVSQNSIAPGESVTFTVDLENGIPDARRPGISIRLGGQQVEFHSLLVSGNTRTEYSKSVSYSDILQQVDTGGDYELTAEVSWPYPAPDQTVSGGTFTVEPFDESEMYSFHGFAPTKRNVQPGDSVQFIANVENHSPVETRAHLFLQLDNRTIRTKDVIIQPNERRNVTITLSHSQLKQEAGGTGDYQLSGRFIWDFRDTEQSQTWGTLSILSEDEDVGGGGGGGNNGGDSDGGGGGTGGIGGFQELFGPLLDSVPSIYLLASGGGVFALLLLAALL